LPFNSPPSSVDARETGTILRLLNRAQVTDDLLDLVLVRSSFPVSATPAIERTGRSNLGEVAELPLPQSWHQTND
jgi:hypothetical protein